MLIAEMGCGCSYFAPRWLSEDWGLLSLSSDPSFLGLRGVAHDTRLIIALMVIFLSLVASVLRHIYIRPGVGVGALQKVYGGALVMVHTCTCL